MQPQRVRLLIQITHAGLIVGETVIDVMARMSNCIL